MTTRKNKQKRLVLPGFLSRQVCEELVFIHKSCSTVGYRPHVFSTTLSHLIATNCYHLIMPLIPIRDRLKEVVEDCFDCHYEISVEFTGLISWTKGAQIGWHSDDNRTYLKQRHYTAVCYLSSHNDDFRGGLFHFQEGEPSTYVPRVGDVLLYTADEQNIHCVDGITEGERFTLTLWFTRDSTHSEDTKLISQLSGHIDSISSLINTQGSTLQYLESEESEKQISDSITLHSPTCHSDLEYIVPKIFYPLPASSNMYWVDLRSNAESDTSFNKGMSANDYGQNLCFDIRWFRIMELGFGLSVEGSEANTAEEQILSETSNNCSSLSFSTETLDQPLRLTLQGNQLPELFMNSLHALQVAEFFKWKSQKHSGNSPGECVKEETCDLWEFSQSKDYGILTTLHSSEHCKKSAANCISTFKHKTIEDFYKAFHDWEHYTYGHLKALLVSFPEWKANQMIYFVSDQSSVGFSYF